MANINTTQPLIVLFDAITTDPATSDAYSRDFYGLNAVQVTGADASNTVDIEGSLDGTNFVKIGSTLNAEGITQISGFYRYLRAKRLTGDTTPMTVVLFSGDRLEK